MGLEICHQCEVWSALPLIAGDGAGRDVVVELVAVVDRLAGQGEQVASPPPCATSRANDQLTGQELLDGTGQTGIACPAMGLHRRE
jgi:hypothetical protein